ncbi:MAG TPA: ABC transporter substrate-binding protein [Kofleriaceae bacterium]|jgi:ABC-type branched-subunit amino acid transport system substrate-binding protein|nr:ABC transporter substrate-binding protein [Kofleriaceae bacterium]
MKHVLIAFSVAAVSCTTEFTPKQCALDSECGNGTVCEMRGSDPVCVHVEDAPIIVGQSAPISGTNQALGTAMKLGIEIAFDEQNAAGGIRGRKLELSFRDDAYQPNLAESAARSLVDAQVSTTEAPKCPSTMNPSPGQAPVSNTAISRGPQAVIAMLGSVGTPTMVRAAPVAVESGTIFFGAFTGAQTILRDMQAGPCGRYIFNIRASYAEEAYATMELFKKRGVSNYKNVISFDQNDSFGQAGYDGLVDAYRNVIGNFPGSADSTNPIVRFRYTRNDDASVPAQANAMESYLAQLLSNQGGVQTVGIFMTDTYGAGAELIKQVRTWQFANDSQQQSLQKASRLRLYFSNVSFVGPNALAERLVSAGTVTTPNGPMPLTENVIVSQVVPNYQSDQSDTIAAYNRLLAARGMQPDFTSLEGYLSARVFIAGLLAHEGPFTPDALVKTFEKLPDLALGIGASSGFSPNHHQYSSSVFGTSIQPDGSFSNLYFWSDGSSIQFFE